MGEFSTENQEQAVEFDREKALDQVIELYLADDKEFLNDEHDLEERVGAVYGMLLELDEDPDQILQDVGVLDKEDEDDEV